MSIGVKTVYFLFEKQVLIKLLKVIGVQNLSYYVNLLSNNPGYIKT